MQADRRRRPHGEVQVGGLAVYGLSEQFFNVHRKRLVLSGNRITSYYRQRSSISIHLVYCRRRPE